MTLKSTNERIRRKIRVKKGPKQKDPSSKGVVKRSADNDPNLKKIRESYFHLLKHGELEINECDLEIYKSITENIIKNHNDDCPIIIEELLDIMNQLNYSTDSNT